MESMLREMPSSCPYCGAPLALEVDLSEGLPQAFTYDCTVCCRPIEVTVSAGNQGRPSLKLRTEDEIG
jgi:hypothetical protein